MFRPCFSDNTCAVGSQKLRISGSSNMVRKVDIGRGRITLPAGTGKSGDGATPKAFPFASFCCKTGALCWYLIPIQRDPPGQDGSSKDKDCTQPDKCQAAAELWPFLADQLL